MPVFSQTQIGSGVPQKRSRDKGPIDVRFQKIAEAAVFDVLRQPIDVPVVIQHLLFELAGFDKPTSPRILDERIFFGPPAERIFVAIFFAVKEQPAIF